VKIIPIARFVLQSQKTPEEIMARLAEQVPARPIFLFRKPKTYFEGQVAEYSFHLTRAAYWGRNIFTTTSGKISANNGMTLINVLQHPGVFGWCWLVGAGLFFVFVLLAFLNDVAIARSTGFGLSMGLIMPLIMVAMFLNDFWRSTQEAKAALIELLEGEEV